MLPGFSFIWNSIMNIDITQAKRIHEAERLERNFQRTLNVENDKTLKLVRNLIRHAADARDSKRLSTESILDEVLSRISTYIRDNNAAVADIVMQNVEDKQKYFQKYGVAPMIDGRI